MMFLRERILVMVNLHEDVGAPKHVRSLGKLN
jgi:hypothetical protein